MNRLLTTNEAAELLRVSARTVLNWIERDAVPYVALPNTGEGRRQYRIPLYGLLSSLEGTYDLSKRIHELDEQVRATRVRQPHEQIQLASAFEETATAADDAVEHLRLESA